MSDVQLDFKILATQATNQLSKLNKNVKEVGKSVSTTRIAFANLIGNAALSVIKNAASAIAGSFGTIVGEAQRLELVTKQFETLTGSAALANKMVSDIKKAAASTPFEISGLQNASKLLLATGESVDGVIPRIKQLGDIASTGSGDIEGLTTVFAKISGQGRVTAETFETLLHQAPIMGQALAQAAGVDGIGALRQAMSEGKVTAEVFNKAIVQATSEGGKAFNAMATQMETYEGITSNLSDTITNFAGDIGKQILPIMKVFGKTTIDALDSNTDAWVSWVQNGVLTAVDSLIGFVPYINSTISAFRLMGDALILTKDAVLTGFWAIESAISGVLLTIVSAAEGLVSALPDSIVPDGWKENLAVAKEALSATTDEMVDKTFSSAANMADNFDKVGESFEETVSQEGLNKIKARLEEAKVAVQENSNAIIAAKEEEKQKIADLDNTSEEDKAKKAAALERERKFQEDLKGIKDEYALMAEEERLLKEEEELVRKDENFAKLVEDLGRENAIRLQAAQNLGAGEAELETLRTKAMIDQSKARIKAANDEVAERRKIQERQAKQFQLTEKAKAQWERGTWDDRINQTRTGLQSLSNLMNSSNKAAFAVGKSAAIVNATVQTYQAATGAYASLAGIPIVGPALGAAAAAAAIVAGLANVSKIKSQRPPETATFADGGIVGGNSYVGDKVPAFVNSGEMILNRQQQATLFNQANGGGDSNNSILGAIQSLGDRIANMEIVIRASDYEIGRSVRRAMGDGLLLTT